MTAPPDAAPIPILKWGPTRREASGFTRCRAKGHTSRQKTQSAAFAEEAGPDALRHPVGLKRVGIIKSIHRGLSFDTWTVARRMMVAKVRRRPGEPLDRTRIGRDFLPVVCGVSAAHRRQRPQARRSVTGRWRSSICAGRLPRGSESHRPAGGRFPGLEAGLEHDLHRRRVVVNDDEQINIAVRP